MTIPSFAPSSFWHALQWVDSRDIRLMHRVNRWRAPRWIRLWMTAATRGGDGSLWYAIGLAVAAFGGDERFRALPAAVLSAGSGVALFLRMKRVCGRKRPCALAAAGVDRMTQNCWAKVLPPDQFSFPSGHTITAFSVASSLGHFYPAMQPGLLFCAASVAASRVLLGMHFLTDVLVGALIGASLGRAFAFLLG